MIISWASVYYACGTTRDVRTRSRGPQRSRGVASFWNHRAGGRTFRTTIFVYFRLVSSGSFECVIIILYFLQYVTLLYHHLTMIFSNYKLIQLLINYNINNFNNRGRARVTQNWDMNLSTRGATLRLTSEWILTESLDTWLFLKLIFTWNF